MRRLTIRELEQFNILHIAALLGLKKTVFIYPEDGILICNFIIDRLNKSDIFPDSFLNLDCEGIEYASNSFCEALFVNLQTYVCEDKNSHYVVFLSNLNELTKKSLVNTLIVLGSNSTPILYKERESDSFEIIGPIEESLKKTYNTVCSRETTYASDIVQVTGIAINNASTRLKKLFDAHLIDRYNDEKGLHGAPKTYFPFRLPE